MKQFGTGLRIAAAAFAAAVAVCFGAAMPSVADENTPPQPVETVDGGPVVTNPVPIPGTDPPAVVAPGPDPVPTPAPADSAASDPAPSGQAPADLTPAAPRTDFSQPAVQPPVPHLAPVMPAAPSPDNIPGTEAPAADAGAEPAVEEQATTVAEPTTDASSSATPAAAVQAPSATGSPTTGTPVQAAAVAPTGSPLIVQLLTVGLLLVVGFFYFRFLGARTPRTPAKSAK